MLLGLDIELMQLLKEHALTSENILDIWAYRVDMGTDYPRLCNVVGLEG